MNIFSKYLESGDNKEAEKTPIHNCKDIAIKLCKTLNVNVGIAKVKKDLLAHPNYPSLQSISDVLSNYKVKSSAIKTDLGKTKDFPTPFIIEVKEAKESNNIFGIIMSINGMFAPVEWYNPEKRVIETIRYQELMRRFTGRVLLTEKSEPVHENNYSIQFAEGRKSAASAFGMNKLYSWFTSL